MQLVGFLLSLVDHHHVRLMAHSSARGQLGYAAQPPAPVAHHALAGGTNNKAPK